MCDNFKIQNKREILSWKSRFLNLLSDTNEKKIKKAIHQWHIEKEYKTLSKNERWNKNTLAFLFFWIGFGVFICLGAKFMGGYLIE
ncbi:hypothetical protein [Pseudotamlana carrageenivorans]|uniref:Uncharacterized protein n=1 Tax=Pseudotamlana carrageenivorans TaxID=2069432 RepID=A0A2I7SMC3_9FLAO|nr:hypothetical protein [Tamlana carrageenivorans]AUS07030.1 hypothetical protein C1A40_16970 [Tamlana carrageenivorans]